MARPPHHCSFCGKSRVEVVVLLGGPDAQTAICDECAALVGQIAAAWQGPHGDVLLTGIGELVTNDPRFGGPLGVVTDAALATRGTEVVWAGPAERLPDGLRELPTIDVEGRAVVPGFVDPHTHLVFAGDRADEFARRLRGEPYETILAAGGGIHRTVDATRAASFDELLEGAKGRVDRMLRQGTTTVEVKSGYGLETETELRQLEVAATLARDHPIDVVTTFLGAHVVPPEYGDDREGYLRLLEEEMIPACAPLAVYCDVFCDDGAFTVDEARRVLTAGLRHGLRPRIHAEQLARTGGALLAADIGAVTADHLEHVTKGDAEALARAGVVAVLLPTASWCMRTDPAPARTLIDAGVTIALGTDCNPGTSYVESMPLTIAAACLEMGLTPEEALWAATRGGALAVEEPDKGHLVPGAVADIVVLDAPSYRHIPYRPGTDLVWAVLKDGRRVAG